MNDIEVTYCIVNTAQRDKLAECLDAVGRERAAVPFTTEVLVLDNFSQDGSAELAQSHPAVDRVIALPRRRGKAENDSELIGAAHGRFCLLLNEDAFLKPGATAALHSALEEDPLAAAAGARLLNPAGKAQASAWRFPSWGTVLAGALLLHRFVTVQSGGTPVTRRVDWAQSAAMLLRTDTVEAIGRLDPAYFVYSDETDLCKRLADRGRPTLYVPGAEAVHHEGLSTGDSAERRIVEFARGRDRYLRTHLGSPTAIAMRPLIAFPYLLRSVAARALPGHDPQRYLAHARAAMRPRDGEGLREAAAAFNRRESARAAA
ncbi:MAG: glycosyltransferase family 2 protein [Actinomycetes bacterium]